MLPLPLPEAPEVTEIQLALLAAVHRQPDVALTLSVLVVALAATDLLVELKVMPQVGVAILLRKLATVFAVLFNVRWLSAAAFPMAMPP